MSKLNTRTIDEDGIPSRGSDIRPPGFNLTGRMPDRIRGEVVERKEYSRASSSNPFSTRAVTIPSSTGVIVTTTSEGYPKIDFVKKDDADQEAKRQRRRPPMLSRLSGRDIWDTDSEEDSEENSELSSVGEGIYPQDHRVQTSLHFNEQESTTPTGFYDSGKVDEGIGKPSENNAMALIFRQMKGKAWKSSEKPILAISSTISKDNTAGEEARKAKLFFEFAQKIQSKNSTFNSMSPQSLSSQDRLDFEPPMTFDAQQARQSIPQTSSYWSVPEKNDFPVLLRYFGTDFRGIAKHMTTKTYMMVKGYYQRQVDSGKEKEWEEIAKQADKKKERGEYIGSPPQLTLLGERYRQGNG